MKKQFETKEEAIKAVNESQMSEVDIQANANKVEVVKKMPEMVMFEFRNERDGPQVPLTFHFHSANCPLKHYTLWHGKQYTLPVEIVEHIENCKIAQYEHKVSEGDDKYMQGQLMPRVTHYKYSFGCKMIRKAA
jgi:hypothetical protein